MSAGTAYEPAKDAALGLAHPAGRDAGAPRLVLDVDNRFRVLLDFLLDAIHLGEGLLAVAADACPLRGIIAGGKVGGQSVDTALQRVGERLRALEGVTLSRDAVAPGLLVLLRFFGHGRLGGVLNP